MVAVIKLLKCELLLLFVIFHSLRVLILFADGKIRIDPNEDKRFKSFPILSALSFPPGNKAQ